MNPRHELEVDPKELRRELQPTWCFMINCLLYSRVERGLVADPERYDEDVNVYLAHLLHAFINPEYAEPSKKLLSKYDSEVFRRLAAARQARLRYVIHKTPADFLLVSVGVFENAPSPGIRRAQAPPAEEAYIGRGKTYYHFAYTFTRHAHRRNAGVAEVLEKLTVGFDKYLKILSHMRGAPLDLAKELAGGEVYHLERSVDEDSQQELLRVKQDELLELYAAWRERPTPEVTESLERVVGEIRQINPEFRFELPKR